MITSAQREAWSCPPVDDVGYLPSAELLGHSDAELVALMERVVGQRYSGWRNHHGLWVKAMKLDAADGLHVLDYGCGIGVEALTYARAGATVSVADIAPGNVALATRMLTLHGYTPAASYLLADETPLIPGAPQFDVVTMSGVLHHIPHPVPVVQEVASWLHPGGQLRIMVYSDRGWRLATGTEPPADVGGHPQREQFVRAFDAVGDWADWYDEQRLTGRFGRWFDVREVTYITPDLRYLTAELVRRQP